MFEEIRIENLGVISGARVVFGPGLTVLTGETGAGKTMVLTGLDLLLGGKADAGAVRTGQDRAVVEGRITVAAGSPVHARVEEAGAELDDDGSLVLLRTVAAEGRSRAHLGGRSVPQSVLAELADELVTVHGQADQARLRPPARHREALDAFAGAEHEATLAIYRADWAERARLGAEIDELSSRGQDRAREAGLLRLGLAEVGRVAPQPGEDVELAAEADRLGHAEDLRTAAAQAHDTLAGDRDGVDDAAATIGIDRARRALEAAGDHDPQLAGLAARLADLGYLLADISVELSGYLEDLDADPLRLEAVQQRRAELGQLTRSYGEDIDRVLAWAQTAGLRLLDLDGGGEQLTVLVARPAGHAQVLTAGRQRAAETLAAAVTGELAGLAMAGARLRVDVTDAGPGPWGDDQVEMLLVSHAGAPARPLGKGASGGELSRVMLAIEVSLATSPESGARRPPTFVFDEVDAGVGGKAAVEVGRRLALLARGSQVLVVTHLAQVAAFADTHLVVTKSTSAGIDTVTDSDVRPVTGNDRVRELARMLSGQESEAARTHAAELLELSGMGR
ncbi:MAG: DNA repair protein RecN [Cellulomonas sp.]|nr:DNA repair protein RecN [Cellulomonas sp.]